MPLQGKWMAWMICINIADSIAGTIFGTPVNIFFYKSNVFLRVKYISLKNIFFTL